MRNHRLSVASLTVLIFVSLSHAQQKQPVERTDQLLRSADEARSFDITEAPPGAPSAAQQSEPTRVRASESIPRHISGGETHEYLVVLNARHALHVVVNQLGVDVVVSVSGPDRESIIEMDSPNGSQGPESVWVIASKTGDYIFRVHPLQRTASGRYEFRVETIHDATAEDQTRVRMQRAVVNSTRLLQGGRENRTAVAKELKEAFVAALQIKDTTTASTVSTAFVRLDPKAALDILGVPSAPGEIPLYYSRGYEQRGRELRERLTGAIRFFESRLNVAPKVMLTVLSQEDWTVLTSIPQYPLPWCVVPSSSVASDRAALVAMPATRAQGGGEFAAMMQPGALPGDVVKSLEATGLAMEDGLRLATDGIMYHELGHVYADALGLPPRANWLSEFFANFLFVAYFTDGSVDPRAVAYTNAWMTGLRSMNPTNTSLEDFDRLYSRVSNYGWYQAQFGKRAADVYKAQGLGFLKRARDVLPPTNQPIAVDEALKRLEQVSPGFVEWAASLSARK